MEGKVKFKKFNNHFLYIIVSLLLASSCSTSSKKKNHNIEDYRKSIMSQKLTITPGEVVKVLVDNVSDYQLFCKNKLIPTFESNNKLVGFVSETYFSKMKKFSCFLKKGSVAIKVIDFKVVKRDFPKERLYVDKKRVWLSKKNQLRVKREQKVLNKIYKNTESYLFFNKPFVLPLTSYVTSQYGTKRIFNNNKQGQHLGIDYRASVGVNIFSTNKGKIVFSGDLFYTGNTVIIDHGLGIFTVYGHMSKLLTSEGEIVTQGTLIGKAGATGRVSGPHLHWGVKVQGNWVDGNTLVKTTQGFNEVINYVSNK